MSTLIDSLSAFATLAGLPLTGAGVFYAYQAAASSKRSLQLQEAEIARRIEFERPGLTAEYEVEKGQRRVSIVHARPAPLPYWEILTISTMDPTVAMLRRSVDGSPTGAALATLEVRERLCFDQRGLPAPSSCRFFVVWNAGPRAGPPASVRLNLVRMDGEAWHQDFEVPRQ